MGTVGNEGLVFDLIYVRDFLVGKLAYRVSYRTEFLKSCGIVIVCSYEKVVESLSSQNFTQKCSFT